MSLDRSSLDVYIEHFLTSLNCPRALAVLIMYREGEHDQLAMLGIDPHHYCDVDQFRTALAATKFLSKASFLSTTFDRKEVSLKKFFESEQVCRDTNRRIDRCEFKDPRTPAIMMIAARKIDSILGDISAEELVESGGWGPGATTSIGRRFATSPTKFDLEGRITADAYDFVEPWFSAAYPNWDVQWKIDGASKIVTVPKDAKSDRTIAIEPGINLWFQKGIGLAIRRRLRRHGIDLNTQEYNQKRACLGSKTNHLATVDFSSASDTISRAVVRELLPPRWHLICDIFRSKYGKLAGTKDPIFFEKFSSMGNGFTFELESLIFYALASACCSYEGVDQKGLSVFGDDVTLPVNVFDFYQSVCADLGFSVNRGKSYFSSYYRESCGSHWWNGVDVKPIFQKGTFDGKTAILKAANGVRRLAHRYGYHSCDARFRRCWSFLAQLLGKNFPRISEGYGDLALIENIDESKTSYVRAKHGYEGYLVRVYAVQAAKKYFDSQGLFLTRLRQIGSSLVDPRSPGSTILDDISGGNYIPMPLRTRTARTRILVPRWYDLGPWM